jgi:hypothetical protein
MDVLGWFWWTIAKLLGFVWSIGWFLLGGWIVTLAQLAVIAFVVYGYKYGWRRAPLELARHGKTFGQFIWAWMRSREMSTNAASGRGDLREVVRTVRRKEAGDINVSTLLSVLALFGLSLVVLGS